MKGQLDASLHMSHAGKDLKSAKCVVVLLHGRGSSDREIIRLAESFESSRSAFIAPCAKTGSWYPSRFLAPIHENEPYLSQGLDAIEELVAQLECMRIPERKIALVGFSQGACLALEYVSRSNRDFGFVAALSGALIGPIDQKHEGKQFESMPALIACAQNDRHIPLEHVKKSATVFRERGARVSELIFPGDSHTVFPEEIAWLAGEVLKLEEGDLG